MFKRKEQKKEPVRLYKKEESKFEVLNMMSKGEQLTIIIIMLLLLFLIIFALYESIAYFVYNRGDLAVAMIMPLLR